MEPPAEAVDALPAPASQERYLLPVDAEVPGPDVGYGPGGASVQREDLGLSFKDREIMKRTVMRGQCVVFGSDVCEAMKCKADGPNAEDAEPAAKRAKTKRNTLRLPQWKLVMQAGLDEYRVGVYDAAQANADKKGARVTFDLPPSGDICISSAWGT